MTLHLLSPGDPNQKTGGYLYNRRIVDCLREAGHEVCVHNIDGDWPSPPTVLLPTIAPGEPIMADGLLWTGLKHQRAELASNHTVVVLCHSPLYRDAPDLATAASLRRAEEQALLEAHGVIATGEPTLRALHFEVPTKLIIPGTDSFPATTAPKELRLLTSATLTKRKGHDVLLAGLELCSDLPFQWRIAGSTHRDPLWFEKIQQLIERSALRDRVTLLGELDTAEIRQEVQHASVLLQGALFEAFGMSLAEALASGVPVISPPAGALVQIPVPAYTPFTAGDPHSCAIAIRDFVSYQERAREAAAQTKWPTWSEQATLLYTFVSSLHRRNFG